MESGERRRRMDELRTSNQQIRRLAHEGNVEQIGQLTSQIKRNLELETLSDSNSIRFNNQTSAFNIVEHVPPYEEESKRRNMLDRLPSPIEDPKPVKPRKKSFHAFALQAKTTEQEILDLKQQRLNGELELKELHREVEQLRNELEQLKSSPIFRLNQRLELFCTKIYVRQEDYHKVDYTRFQIELEATCLNIRRQETVWRTLQLERIKEVKYLDKRMMLEFQADGDESDYLFLSFDDLEHLRKWDLGMYANRFLMVCSRKDKLFWSEYSLPSSLGLNSSPIQAIHRPREPTVGNSGSPPVRKGSYNETPPPPPQKKIDPYRQPIIEEETASERQNNPREPQPGPARRARLASREESEGSVGQYSRGRRTPTPQLQQRRAPLVDSRTRNQEPSSRSPPNFTNSSFGGGYQEASGITTPTVNISVNESDRSNPVSLERNYQKEKQRIDDVSKEILEKRKLIREKKDEARIEFKPPSDNEEEKPPQSPPQYPSATSQLTTTYNSKPMEPQESPRQDSPPPITGKLNLFPKEMPVLALQPADLNNSTISVEEAEQSKRQIIDNLRKPKQFMKYAKGGLKPRLKQVYLSDNEQELCWKDVETKKVNKIKVATIQQILVGQLGEGMRRHDSKLDREQCLLIKTSERVLELHSAERDQVKRFANELEFLRNLQKSVTGD